MSHRWESYFAEDAKALEKFSESPGHSYAFLESVTLSISVLNCQRGRFCHFVAIGCLKKYGMDYLECNSVQGLIRFCCGKLKLGKFRQH